MKVVVVFVEGQADASYVLRSLGQVVGAKFDERRPEDLPTPFGKAAGQGSQNPRGIVRSWNERVSFARTLAASAEDNEPVFQAVAKVAADPREPGRPGLVFIVRMGGDRKALEVSKLLKDFDVSFNSNLTHDVTQLACAFVFDADTPRHYQALTGDCVQLRELRFASDYASYLPGSGPLHSSWVATSKFPIGLFVLHAITTRSGTLEHVVEPALQVDPDWQSRLQTAENALVAHEHPDDPIYDKHGAERAKARLTIAGQWRDPGSSLAQILRRGDHSRVPSVPDSVFTSSEATALVNFLMSAPWR